MNPENFSREEIEQRLTALLLGELPAEEAALLRYTISQDAELTKLHERLKQTIDFTREAVATPAEPATAPTAPLKLSDERREKLLAHFKLAPPRVVTPEEMGVKRFKISRVIEVLAVVAVLGILAAMLLPSLASAKRKARSVTAQSEMKMAQLESEVDKENRRATPAPMTPPAVATASPQPTLREEIVLPKTQEASTGAYGGVISAGVVGYYNDGNATEQNEQSTLQNHALTADREINGNTTFGARSLDDKSAKDSGTTFENKLSISSQQPNGSLAYNSPQGQFPATDEVAFDDRKFGVNAAGAIAGTSGVAASQNLGEDQLAINKTRDVGTDRTPLIGDLPVAGRLFQSQSVTPPLPGAMPASPVESPAPALAVNAPTVSGQLFIEREARINFSNSTISGDTFALNGNNSFAGEPTINGGTLGLNAQKAGAGTLAYNGVTKDAAGTVRFLLQTNAVALNRGGEGGGGGSISKAIVPVDSLAPVQTVNGKIDEDRPLPKVSQPAPIPQPEMLTRENVFSTFSLNVSDVSLKLAAVSLQNGQLPDAASIRSEEFINAFDYRDPEAPAGVPVAFAWERARDPFAHNRDLLRFSIKTAAQGREANRPLNIVLLLDNSGSMERADRVQIIREALRVLAAQLHPQDIISVITFARTPRLWADGISGDKAGETLDKVGGITPDGGTNLEEAMNLAYQTALRHYLANGANRVVLLTDGAANLGNVNPDALKQKVESFRKQGVALDCFGIGWEDYNDDLLEELSSNGDGRYGFLNSPEEAANGFATQLAGALKVAAQDVKVQVEFNPQRVTSWRQIGYAKHQLTKQQFRDNSVAAGEIAAQEAGNALYTIEVNPNGEGSIATVRVRYKIPGTSDYREQSWDVPYTGSAVALEKSSAAMRLATTAGEFSEWLAASPFAQEVTPDELLNELSGVPQIYGADTRPKQLEWMIRQAKSISGK